jgi:hypothetical protein
MSAEEVVPFAQTLTQIQQLFQGIRDDSLKTKLTNEPGSELLQQALAMGFMHTWDAWKCLLLSHSHMDMLAAFRSDPGRLTAVNPVNFDWELAKLGKEDLRGLKAQNRLHMVVRGGGTRYYGTLQAIGRTI